MLELEKGKIYTYQANFTKYLEMKAEREERLLSEEKKRQNFLRNELEWVRRGAQARSTKQKARLQRFEEVSAIRAPEEKQSVDISSVNSRLGKKTIELEHVCKGYNGVEYIHDFSYIILRNDRVGITGNNGCGKTTLPVSYTHLDVYKRQHLTVDNTGKLLHMMEEGKIDFAIVEGFFDKEKYDFTLYKRERFMGICGKVCPLRGKPISLWETHTEPLILREPGSGTRDILEELLKENNFTIHSYSAVQEISNFQAIKVMTEASLGITFLYEPVVKQDVYKRQNRETAEFFLGIYSP